MKLIGAILLFLLISIQGLSQQENAYSHIKDSLLQQLKNDSLYTYRPKKWRPYVSYDKRNSFLRRLPVNYSGIQIGCVYRNLHTFGFGAYEIHQNANESIVRKDNQENDVAINIYLKYVTLFYQYEIINQRYFELDIPIELGFGQSKVRVSNASDGQLINNLNQPIFPIGGGLQIILKPVRWCGLSLMGGYRYVGETYKNLNFNGTYYSIGLWVNVQRIYRDIKYFGFQKRKYKKAIKNITIH